MEPEIPNEAGAQVPPALPGAAGDAEPLYGGYTRFEIELEVGQAMPCSCCLFAASGS